jgi:tetratricopeptide (TPR) repeat protein
MASPDALTLNNQAIDSMRLGDFKTGAAVLRSALKKLRHVLSSPPHISRTGEEQDSFAPHASCNLPIIAVYVEEAIAVEAEYSSLLSLSSIPQDHNTFSLYGRAFLMKTSDEKVISKKADVTRVCTVVLYNLGLCYLLLAVKNGQHRHVNLVKAMQLFELAVDFLNDDSFAPEKDLLLLSALNNLGHVYFHFFKVDEAQKCLERLHSVLADAHERDVNLLPEEYHLFTLNVIMLYGKCAVVVAPAA